MLKVSFPSWRSGRAYVGAALIVFGIAAAHAQSQRRSGDVLATAMPIATLGTELVLGDRDGAWQYALTLTVSMASTEVLKKATHVERPDGSNDKSFPSGHAVRAFSVSSYVRRRHGLDAAWPLYVAGLYVGHTRAAIHRHRWRDIAGAALVSEGAALWFVEPRTNAKVVVTPVLSHGSFGLHVTARM